MDPYATNQYPQCNTCPQRRCCIDIYKQLGQSKGPSVVIKVVVALVIPLVVFISVLFVGDNLLGRWLQKGAGRTLFSLLIALVVSVLCVWMIKLFTRRYVDEPDSSANVADDKHF